MYTCMYVCAYVCVHACVYAYVCACVICIYHVAKVLPTKTGLPGGVVKLRGHSC